MTKGDDKGCGPKWGWARRAQGWGGGHWARGGPFGFSSIGGSKPGRMFGPGDLRLLLLALIADKPSHGYDLIRTIEEKFGGSYAPSPGAIYPTLTLLEEQELIENEASNGGKKSYAATLAGRQYLAANSDQVKALMARIDIMAGATGKEALPESIMHAVMTLRHSIMSKAYRWNEPEVSRIITILEKAARDIIAPEKK